MREPLVTIITPTYNHEGFIGECIQSVLGQQLTNWEQVIVNDGSSDQTGEIASRYAKIDDRITYIAQENKGIWRLSETYNTALERTKGKWIAILEGDDYWPPHALRRLVEIAESLPEDYAVVYGHSITVGNDEGRIVGKSLMPNDYQCPEHFSHQIYTPIASIPPQASLIRRSSLEKIGGFLQPEWLPLVDRPTFLMLSIEYKFYYVDEIFAYWRQHGNNVTTLLSLHMAAGAIPWVKEFFEGLDASHQKRLKMQENESVQIHRRIAFWSAASYLQNVEHADTLYKRIANVSKVVLPHVGLLRGLGLRAIMTYLRIGIDLRGPFHRIKGAKKNRAVT